MGEPKDCRCQEMDLLRGELANDYARTHLRLIERGRDSTGAEDYQCDGLLVSWVMDFPYRRGTDKGEPRLRRLPLPPGAPPIGAPWETSDHG